jgi:four helix bundle protein
LKENNIIQDRSFAFALKIIELYKVCLAKNEFALSKQLVRSGTSIGANVEEALAGQSKKDFIAKMSISSKEARETKYWLRLLEKSNLIPFDYKSLFIQNEERIRILTAIVKTSQAKLRNER